MMLLPNNVLVLLPLMGIAVRGFSEAHGAAECLLQNQFINEKLLSTDEEVMQIKQQDSLELQSLQEQLLRSAARHQEYLAHSFHLHRMLRALHNATKLPMSLLHSDSASSVSSNKSIVLTTSNLVPSFPTDKDDLNVLIATENMTDLGSGCCEQRNTSSMLFKGMSDDLGECKAKCLGLEGCAFIEYGWKDSNWCTAIPKGTECSSLANGPDDCGSGGGDNGVHTYQMMATAAPAPSPSADSAAVADTDAASASDPESSVVGQEMDDLLGKMIDSQSGSEDTCHSQLREAKHQLKSLHVLVVDLARQVNSTEAQIMMMDRELQEKLHEMSDVSQWRDGEQSKCKVQTEEAQKMYSKLKVELYQMNSIASPSVSLDVGSGKLKFVNADDSTQVEFSLAQTGQGIKLREQHKLMTVDFVGGDHEELGQNHHFDNVRPSSVQKPRNDLDELSGLLRATRQASQKFQNCIESARSARMSVALLSEGVPTKTTEECEKCKRDLQKTYVKAHVELSRMVVQYEEQANSTACSDSIQEQYKNQKTPLQESADKISGEINDKTEEMQTLRPRLQSSQASEVKLRKQVSELTSQCAELSPTISALDSVRNALNALSACPGMKTFSFSLPKWTGQWVTFHQDSAAQTDAEQDRLMNTACSTNTAGSRAAEVGEIQERTVQGIPKINSAPTPLLGACPGCEGDRDETFQSGHSRACWDPDAPLSFENRRNNCGAGKKAILCVMDSSTKQDTTGSAEGAEEVALTQF